MRLPSSPFYAVFIVSMLVVTALPGANSAAISAEHPLPLPADADYVRTIAVDFNRAAAAWQNSYGPAGVTLFDRDGDGWLASHTFHAPTGAYSWGRWIVIQDDLVVIGAQGEFFTHQLRSGFWNHMATTRVPSGLSADMDGDTLVTTDGNVFRWSGNDWTVAGTLPNALVYAESITIHDNVIAARLDTGTNARSSVGIFTEGPSGWALARTLVGPQDFDRFGSALSMGYQTLIIGAPYADRGYNQPLGRAYAYAGSGGAWSLITELPDHGQYKSMNFGSTVAANEDTALVGGDQGSLVGVNVFHRTGWAPVHWTPSTTISIPRVSLGTVALDAGTLIMGFETVSAFELDQDGDGLYDYQERNLGTNPLYRDSDYDMLDDAHELYTSQTDPTFWDTDGDGLGDGVEVRLTFTDPLDRDSDDDNLEDGPEVITYKSDPNNPDTDGDTVRDGDEIPHGADPTKADTDNDRIGDADEINLHYTAPNNWDTDGDELSDYQEIFVYHTGPKWRDSDGDLYSDGREVNCGSNPRDVGSVPVPTCSLPTELGLP